MKQEVGMVPHSLNSQALSWNGCSGDGDGHRQSYHIRSLIRLWIKTACMYSRIAPWGMFIAQRIGEHCPCVYCHLLITPVTEGESSGSRNILDSAALRARHCSVIHCYPSTWTACLRLAPRSTIQGGRVYLK